MAAAQAMPVLNGALDFCTRKLLSFVMCHQSCWRMGTSTFGQYPACPWLTEAMMPTFNSPTFRFYPRSRQSDEVGQPM